MKAGTIALAAVWFAGSVYAGYRLTERSFAWLGAPDSGQTADVPAEGPAKDLDALKGMTPAELKEQAKRLSPQQLICLRASIAPERVSAVLSGDITPQEAAAARKCLE
jgi:hypothetical protein